MASHLSSYGSEKPEKFIGTSSKPSSIMTREQKDEKFALGRRGILVVFTLCVLTLMAALDGTSLSVALPVSTSILLSGSEAKSRVPDDCTSLEWNRDRSLLEWYLIPAQLDGYDTRTGGLDELSRELTTAQSSNQVLRPFPTSSAVVPWSFSPFYSSVSEPLSAPLQRISHIC